MGKIHSPSLLNCGENFVNATGGCFRGEAVRTIAAGV